MILQFLASRQFMWRTLKFAGHTHTHAFNYTNTSTCGPNISYCRWNLETLHSMVGIAQNNVGLQLDNRKNATIVLFWFLACGMERTMSVSRPAIASVLAYLAVCVTARCDFRRIHAVPWNGCIFFADFRCGVNICADYHNLWSIYVPVCFIFSHIYGHLISYFISLFVANVTNHQNTCGFSDFKRTKSRW